MIMPAPLDWDVLIAFYFFSSGISVGAAVLASLPLAFGVKVFRPVAGLAIITAIVFAILTPLFVFPHLLQPLRGLTMFTTILTTSPMSLVGWTLLLYIILLLVGGWLALYKLPGAVTPEAEKSYTRIARVIFGVVFLLGLLVLLLQGFEMAVLKSRPLWNSPAVPLLYMLLSVASGLAFVMLVWIIVNKYFTREKELHMDMLSRLAAIILVILIAFLVVNVVEYLAAVHSGVYRQLSVSALFTGINLYVFLVIGTILGAVIPAILLAIPQGRYNVAVLLAASILVLIGAFSVKLGVLLAGQMFAKVPTLIPTLTPVLISTTELTIGVGVTVLALIIYIVLIWLLPWRRLAGGGG